MKKTYIKPQMVVHFLATENRILAASDPVIKSNMTYDLGDENSAEEHDNKDIVIGEDDDVVF